MRSAVILDDRVKGQPSKAFLTLRRQSVAIRLLVQRKRRHPIGVKTPGDSRPNARSGVKGILEVILLAFPSLLILGLHVVDKTVEIAGESGTANAGSVEELLGIG